MRHLNYTIYPCDTLGEYKYVVILTVYEGRLLLSRERARDTWEPQGGHIDPGETPRQAAERELYEESGVRDAALTPLCDYAASDGQGSGNGQVFLARPDALGELPESEMAEARLFDRLPEALTYPELTPALFGLLDIR